MAASTVPDAQPPRTFAVSGPRGLRQLHYLARFLRNYSDANVEMLREFGDVVRIRVPTPHLAFFHPRHVRHILRDNVRNYPKSRQYTVMLRPLLGEGIFVSEGELWARQRRLMAPEFREASVARFLPAMARCADELFAAWAPRVAAGAPIDVSADMMRLTLWVIGAALFRDDFRAETEVIGHALGVCLEHATRQMLTRGLYTPWLPTPGNWRNRRAERALNAAVRRIIARAHGGDSAAPDVLSRMIAASDPESGGRMTAQQLLDETKSLILAGHETTSLALSWALYLLARHPEAEARLAEEAGRVLGDEPPTPAQVAQLSYTRMVLLEAMRLYPPVPAVSRDAVAEDGIDGVRVRAGEMVIVAAAATHRHPDFWERPDAFDPERFSPANQPRIEPWSYFPFLLGRRACMGEHFALLEGTLMLALVVRRYVLTPVDADPIATRPISTLRMARPLVMRARLRT
ncbi:MAG TPA: cytochrome P450 [Vicinamibacteria bacterium]|nr:cytochrome P450 [Vicinamibacteria bacterium]